MFFLRDTEFMRMAIEEARKALEEGEIPVGAVCTIDNTVIVRTHNTREKSGDPTAHAEILALRECAEKLQKRRLNDVTMYVTLEPCAMCAGAIVAARLKRLVFGAYDPLRGCTGSLYRITEDPAMGWFCLSKGGLLSEECEQLLKQINFNR